MVGLAIVGLIAAIAYPSYQQHVIRTRQDEARAALIVNAHFMERRFAQTGDYKQDSRNWPALPISATAAFDIGFSADAGNTDRGRFLLQARPRKEARWLGEDFLEIDQDGNVKLCRPQQSGKRCSMRIM
jgi:type IV pilus assembly protein PilE